MRRVMQGRAATSAIRVVTSAIVAVTAVALLVAGTGGGPPARSAEAPWSADPHPSAATAGGGAVTDEGGTARAAASTTVLVAGDIAGCGWSGDAATARLVARQRGLVMTAGDHAYQYGSSREFRACYEPTWGRFKSRTRPTPGNHDYATPGASGYFDYFGSRAGPGRRGYYALDRGAWRIYALDSNCTVSRGCKPGTAQYRWLKRDLERNPRACVMAVWHHPHFSSGHHGNSRGPRELVRLLYKAGAEIIVNGHDHIYERFAPARPSGRIDKDFGIRQFIVGTGGGPLNSFKDGRPEHSRKRTNRTHGVLKLALQADAYEWRFLPTRKNGFSDRGSGTCHDAPPQ